VRLSRGNDRAETPRAAGNHRAETFANTITAAACGRSAQAAPHDPELLAPGSEITVSMLRQVGLSCVPARDPTVMSSTSSWPVSAEALCSLQRQLAAAHPPRWRIPAHAYTIGGCFVCFVRRGEGPGVPGEAGWADAALAIGARILRGVAVRGAAGGSYAPGLPALREGALLEAAVRALPRMPDVPLVNATGITPQMAQLGTDAGAGRYVDTVTFKVAAGELEVEEARDLVGAS
jgi:hypothetical protein